MDISGDFPGILNMYIIYLMDNPSWRKGDSVQDTTRKVFV